MEWLKCISSEYFEWLWQDNMDLNFEFWPTQLIETTYSGEITFDGKSEYVTTNKIEIVIQGQPEK